jgi:hypothetical protein
MTEKMPTDPRFIKIMMSQYKKAISEPNDCIKFAMSDKPNTWYIMIYNMTGDNDEYTYECDETDCKTHNTTGKCKVKVAGEFLFEMIAPSDFPQSPPHFYTLTPNGVYGESGADGKRIKVCISIGEFHKADYRPVLGMGGFAINLVSGLIGWKDVSHGIHIVRTTADEKHVIARRSRQINATQYAQITALVNSAFDDYSRAWKTPKSKATDADE